MLGEPLPFELLAAIASADAIGEVEARDLVEVTERDGTVRFGFAHPLLAAAAERHIIASRRLRLADALARAAGTGGDLVQRARWELIAGGGRDAPLLVAGARAVLLHQPALAVRMAECALARQPTTEAALLLADGHAESGDPAAARAAIERAGALATSEDEAVAVELGEAAFLTKRELEIARLAARGTSDRDIATVLVVSVRTVESHLASVYRKLSITSRRQLREVVPPA